MPRSMGRRTRSTTTRLSRLLSWAYLQLVHVKEQQEAMNHHVRRARPGRHGGSRDAWLILPQATNAGRECSRIPQQLPSRSTFHWARLRQTNQSVSWTDGSTRSFMAPTFTLPAFRDAARHPVSTRYQPKGMPCLPATPFTSLPQRQSTSPA